MIHSFLPDSAERLGLTYEGVKALRPERTLGVNPLFQVLFLYLQDASGSTPPNGLTLREQLLASVAAKYDLSLHVIDDGHTLRGLFEGAMRGRTMVEIIIDDDGPGIPPDRYEEVFRPFYRLDASRNVDTGGVGLGLTIARDIARAHGGDVMLVDGPLGGLRATIRVPV